MTNTDKTSRDEKHADAATRALKEAKARRVIADKKLRPVELGGRDGPEPTRYNDWEKKGIASDF
ncbi:MAG: DUF1674 domain-containing protein [Alphaproteobacteria bacterium]|nr:DUF1674 domain-containing protein [Alphaproteobacteria bacterium]